MTRGSRLYERLIAPEHVAGQGNDAQGDRRVWDRTPFALAVREDDAHATRDMFRWCAGHCGSPATITNGNHGKWRRECTTDPHVAWYGFATDGAMRNFFRHWSAYVIGEP